MERCSLKEKVCNCKLLLAIGSGQLLSLLVCGTAVTSGILGEKGVNIPTAQSFLNYVLLCVVYTTLLACKRENNIKEVFKLRGWKYFLLAVVDVEANYLIVKAYHYTTVTSVQLLDSFIIPTVLVLSWIFLKMRYKLLHFIGVGVCLLGVVALVLADYFTSRFTDEGTNKLLGDFMVLGASILYGISNVGQEYVVKNFSRVEYLGMIGFFGSLVNGFQFALLERKEVAGINFTQYQTVLSLLGFAICLFLLYSLMPVVIEKTSATSVNLNLLSADFYALIVGIFLFHYKFHVLYFASFAFIIVGLVLYSIRPPPTTAEIPQQQQQTESSHSQDHTNSKKSSENNLVCLDRDDVSQEGCTDAGVRTINSDSGDSVAVETCIVDNPVVVHVPSNEETHLLGESSPSLVNDTKSVTLEPS